MSLKCGSGVFGYRFVGSRIRQHGADVGAIGFSIHNYSGTAFVSWNYYKAGLITEFFKVFEFSGGEVSAGRLGFTEDSYDLGAGLIRVFCEAPALLTISAMAICLCGRAKLRPLARTDV